MGFIQVTWKRNVVSASAGRLIRTVLGIFCALLLCFAAPWSLAQEHKVALLVHNAVIIPVDGSGVYYDPGYLVVDEQGRLVEVAEGVPPQIAAKRTIDAKGMMIVPGFLSGHSHLYQSPFRGLGVGHTLQGWIVNYHRTYGPHYDPTDLYWFSKHGAMDYLAHGITTIFDWTLNDGNDLDSYVGLYRGSLDSGARIIFGYGVDLGKSLAANRDMLADYLELIENEGIDASHPRVPAVWMSGLGLLNGSETASMEFALAQEFSLPMQVHYLEEPAKDYVEMQQDLFPVYKKWNMLGPGFNFAHFINVNEEILQQTGASDTRMIWNPLSNGRLASGLPDIPAYEQHGIKIGMGLDGQASADIADPFENMRMGMYGIRMRYQSAQSMMPIDVLRYHTIGTAEVLGIAEQVGSLEPGKWADFLILDPHQPETSPVIHPVEHLVLSMNADNIVSIFVGGERVVAQGEFVHAEKRQTYDEVQWRLARVKKRLAEAQKQGVAKPPLFESMEGYESPQFRADLEDPRYGRATWQKR